jgi:internalin A
MVAKPNRRWYQFSLKAVFVGMTLLSLGLGVWLKCIEPTERQRAMARRVEQLGGYVRYADAPSDERWPLPTLRQWLPRDYFDALTEINLDAAKANAAKATIIKATIVKATDGDLADLHRFEHLQELWLNGTDVTDATLEKLNGLRELRVVNLRSTKVTDEGLAVFANHSQLQILNLRDTKLTGTGLTYLKNLSHLQILNLRDTDVDDGATKSLQEFEELQSLFLDGTRVTDERKTELRAALPKCDITPENRATLAEQAQAKRQMGAAESVTIQGGRIRYDSAIPVNPMTFPLLAGKELPHVIQVDLSVVNSNDVLYPLRLVHLREFPRLRYLNLSGTNMGDDQLIHITGCTELTQLKLDNTAITDDGLARLIGLKNLTSLSLSKTQVTDSGVIHLAGLPKLRLLQLKDTQVTDKGVENLQRTLPNATIIRQ